MERVAFALTGAFAAGLGLPPRSLDHLFQPHHSAFLRLNYYPPRTAREGPLAAPQSGSGAGADPELGIHPHKDAGFLTVLHQVGLAYRKESCQQRVFDLEVEVPSWNLPVESADLSKCSPSRHTLLQGEGCAPHCCKSHAAHLMVASHAQTLDIDSGHALMRLVQDRRAQTRQKAGTA